MEGLNEAGRGGVEDVDAVFGQPLVGMLDHLVHVLVVLTSILERLASSRVASIFLPIC
jgi:hypothetical protein